VTNINRTRCVQVMDATDEAVYYSLGSWPTLLEAVNAVVSFFHADKEPPISDASVDYEVIELSFLDHPTGFGRPMEVMQVAFESVYDENGDQTRWRWKTLPFAGRAEHPPQYQLDCGCDTCLSYGEPE